MRFLCGRCSASSRIVVEIEPRIFGELLQGLVEIARRAEEWPSRFDC
jgi:hypothetical protein